MPPLTLLVKPASGSCNMKCKYCFYFDEMNNRNVCNYGMMSDDTLEKMVEKAFEFAEKHVNFVFQGGEPTLIGIEYYRKLIGLVKKFNTKKINVFYAIQSNGLLIDDEWAKLFSDHKFLVGISLDGPKDIHNKYRRDAYGEGTFDRVIHATYVLKAHEVDFNILCVINKDIAKESVKVYNFFKKKNYNYLQFIPCLDEMDSTQKKEYSLDPIDYGEFLIKMFDLWKTDLYSGRMISIRMFDNILQILAGYPPESCDMRGSCSPNTVIEADGSVYPCDFYVVDRWKLGNINESSIMDLHRTDVMSEFIGVSRQTDVKCTSCKFYNICKSGCKRHKEPVDNNRISLNYFCPGFFKFYDEKLMELIEILKYLQRIRT